MYLTKKYYLFCTAACCCSLYDEGAPVSYETACRGFFWHVVLLVILSILVGFCTGTPRRITGSSLWSRALIHCHGITCTFLCMVHARAAHGAVRYVTIIGALPAAEKVYLHQAGPCKCTDLP